MSFQLLRNCSNLYLKFFFSKFSRNFFFMVSGIPLKFIKNFIEINLNFSHNFPEITLSFSHNLSTTSSYYIPQNFSEIFREFIWKIIILNFHQISSKIPRYNNFEFLQLIQKMLKKFDNILKFCYGSSEMEFHNNFTNL